MRQIATARIGVLAATAVACAACGSMGTVESTEPTAAYGDRYAVEAAIGAVKSQGQKDRLSSRAIRLPEKPLGEIAVFGYQFPATCGAHEFRVYETDNAQILEYNYAGRDGAQHKIRDYVSSSSPFVEPGLWSALDHTADSISTMASQVSQRGDRMINGAYSSGLVTGLPDVEQRALGSAYKRALNDVYACRDAQTVAGTTGK